MEANSMSRLAVGFLNWAFRSESGGLLNVLFTPSPNTTSTFDLASNEQTIFARLKSLFLGCIWHRGKALLVLKAIPVELGGGASGVDKYHQDPNRSNAMFWSPLGYLLLSLLLTVGMSWKISGRRCKRVRILFQLLLWRCRPLERLMPKSDQQKTQIECRKLG